MSNIKYQKYIPYGLIFIIVLLTELFVFNFSTWTTLSCEPIHLAENVVTDEKGLFETEMTVVDADVKNVNVKLTIDRYDRAEVQVVLTDAGDAYAYALPEYEVVPGIEGDGYQNIYPFGKVDQLQVKVSVPEGTQAQIESIVVNDNRPMDFKILRIMLLFAVLALGYMIFADKEWMKITCKRGSKGQLAGILCVMIVLAAVGSFLVKSNPVCVNSPWPHHRQYQELAHSLKQGTVVVDDKPDPALLEKENPYDTSALLVEGIPFRMDYALYDGNYYAYFGIVPELLFFLPYYLLTGQDLQNYAVVLAFYVMMLIGIFGTLWETVHRFGKKVPFVWYLLLSMAVSLMPNYIFMLGRPDIYNIPVMSGNAFVFLGTFFWMRSVWTDRYICLWYGLGSLCMACVAGCRPQMLLYVIALFGVLFVPLLCQKEWRAALSWKKILAFTAPVLAVAAVVFWYNLARFDSGFNFGATYSLTSNDMNNRGFNFSRVFRGLYSFLFQPPAIHASFPFLESCELEGSYMGKNIVEFCYGGIFAVCPLLLSLLYMLLGGYKKCEKTKKWLVGILCLASFVVAAFDINSAGVLQRYMGDMVFGFILAAVIVLFGLMNDQRESSGYLWISQGTYLALLYGVAFSFLVFITSEDSICLQEYNPQLFHLIQSYFKF